MVQRARFIVLRLWTQIGLLIAALAVAAPGAATEHATAIHRIVAIGDLHGDYAAWREIAQAARLIDVSGRWTGGTTVLVQTGDVVDRGPDSLKIILDLMRLQRVAPHNGGRVVTLVGNHEAMNVTGDLRYVSPGDYAAFANGDSARLRDQVYSTQSAAIEAAYRKQYPAMTSVAIRQAWLSATPLGAIEHQIAWRPDGWIGRWVTANPAVVLLDNTLFVHGGISPAYARTPLAEINRRVAAALAGGDTASASIINDPDGPLWYRGLVVPDGEQAAAGPPATSPATGDLPPPPSTEASLDQVLRAYGASRVVIAHTPILSGIAVLYDGRLIRIDTGISAYYGGKLSYLEIIDGSPVPHDFERAAPSKRGAG